MMSKEKENLKGHWNNFSQYNWNLIQRRRTNKTNLELNFNMISTKYGKEGRSKDDDYLVSVENNVDIV